MNNSNFGYDCRNNVGNCFFAPICNEINKISYIEKHQSLYVLIMSRTRFRVNPHSIVA